MMQPEKLKALLEEIGKAIQDALKEWPHLKCDGCGAFKESTPLILELMAPYMSPDNQERWHVRSIRGDNPGWVRVSPEHDPGKSYCPSCAKERIL